MNRLIPIIMLVLVTVSGVAVSADRLKLDDTSIIGSRELPKVLYIVPWKDTKLGLLSTTEEKGTFEGGMVPLDREIYQREIEYHGMLQGNTGGAAQ